MLMLSLLGNNHPLTLFNMARSFIWIEETKERINEFSIGYMINPKFNFNNPFRKQDHKFTNTTLGEITTPHIRTRSEKRIKEC